MMWTHNHVSLRGTLLVLLTGSLFAQNTLPGTAPLTLSGDIAARMVDGIHSFLDRETGLTTARREALWKRDPSSPAAYRASIAANREHFRKIIGAVDTRLSFTALQYDGTTAAGPLLAKGPGYKIFSVSWPVFNGVSGEGLLLEPDSAPVARIVAIPDADETPEQMAELQSPVNRVPAFARRFAENGCQVLVPVIIDRQDTWSGIPGTRMTNQPHREWIYRQAFEVGRHIIGYEVQKVLAAVDWFAQQKSGKHAWIGVAGFGEGGLLALYSAALDDRIEKTLVSSYFDARNQVWQEPIYRDVWGLLKEFGDAEIASMIVPRTLVVEAAQAPEISGPPPETEERKGATPNGRISTPRFVVVQQEVERARQFFAPLHAEKRLVLIGDGTGQPGSDRAVSAFLGVASLRPAQSAPTTLHAPVDPAARMKRQFDELVRFTQMLVREAPRRRAEFWAKADRSSPARWRESTRYHRDYLWEEMIGRLPDPNVPPDPHTRLIYDEPKVRGYEVTLEVWPGVFAYGILLIPKDLKPGEKRPVVVCQHGLEGRPADVAGPNTDNHYYHRFAYRLAEQGFVTYAPQNPYIFEDRFRTIQRKAHPLKLALFSFILGMHQRQLEWLSSLPFVDRDRIGFYGLSYGGKTAVRVPPFLERYALSICSGDFNEWVWKNTSIDSPYSYLLTREYDMIEFNLANLANYAELASLMAPRPFMVERGHDDTVAPDEWVAYEFAKVRRFYDQMGLAGKSEIEFFNGPHTIHGVGTFEFLQRYLGREH